MLKLENNLDSAGDEVSKNVGKTNLRTILGTEILASNVVKGDLDL